jgi:SAM-dependent methyltransferase
VPVNPPARASALAARSAQASPRPEDDPTIIFYDRNAADYARATRAISLEPEIVLFTSRLPSGSQVLDVGCGSGRDLLALRISGMQPTGLELSSELAKLAAAYSACEVVVGDMRNPPFEPAAFDGIWASASLLHLERDKVLPALHELRLLLKSGGLFFASVKMGQGSRRGDDGRLFTYFQPEEWSALLATAGFRDIQIRTDVENRGQGGAASWMQSLARGP